MNPTTAQCREDCSESDLKWKTHKFVVRFLTGYEPIKSQNWLTMLRIVAQAYNSLLSSE